MNACSHKLWMLGASVAALAIGAPLHAQENGQTTTDPTPAAEAASNDDGEIVVTGSRAIAEGFVATKRNATGIVDSISESEIGTLPARNAAELVSVLPGVLSYTDRTGDTELTTTESRFASVRGIRPDLNITTLDGINLAIPNEAGRSNFLDWFPVSLASRVEVIKTFAPENDGNAIGGQINVVTRSGFDYPNGLFTVTASASFDELNTTVTGRKQPFDGSVVFARPLSDTVAVALTANFNRRDVSVPSRENVGRVAFNADGTRATFFPGFNNFIGPVPGNGIAVPLTNRLYANRSQTDRWGAAGKLDFRPDDRSYLWLTGAYSRLDQNVLQSYSDVRQPFICFAFAGCVNQAVAQSGDIGTIRIRFDDAAFSEMATSRNLSQLTSFQTGARRDIGETSFVEFKAGYSRATQDQEDYFSFFGQDARDILFDYDLSDPLRPAFSIRDAAVFDPATYKLRRVDYIPLTLRETVFDAQFNAAYNFDGSARGFGVKAGVRYKASDRRKAERFVQNNVAIGSAPVLLTAVQSSRDVFSLDIPGITSDARPVLGNPLVRNQLLLPLLADPARFTPTVLTDEVNRYTLSEQTFALYGQAQYRTDRLQIVGGVRYELTDLDGTGFRQTDGGAFQPVRSNNSRGFLLPSLIVNWDAIDTLKLRAAYSRSLGRPPYAALAPRGETLTTDPQLGTASLSRSNPDLKPRRSDNFDLALEWYFDGGKSLASVGGFYKDIKDEIFVSSTIAPMVINGVTYATTITEPMNTQGAKLHGAEFNLVKVFSFLPAPLDRLGIQANATLIDGDFSLQRPKLNGNGTQTPGFIPSQPKEIYNIALFYSDRAFDLNLSLNKTGAYVIGFFPDAPQNDIYLLGRDILNIKASYAFNEHFRLFVEGTNLTSRDLIEVSGPPRLKNIRRIYASGATVTAGATLTW